MFPALSALKRFWQRCFSARNSEKLYDRIVAQARLPALYRDGAIPDTIEGRFLALSLPLFAVLHRLKQDGSKAVPLARDLADHFSRDMDAVLREQGMSDLKVPKSMRNLVASSRALLEGYESAYAEGEGALAAFIEGALPQNSVEPGLTSRRLASYVTASVRQLDEQPLSALETGTVTFPPPHMSFDKR